MKVINVLRSKDNVNCRVTFATEVSNWFVVVKLWRGRDLASIKFWHTKDIAKCQSYWQTNLPVTGKLANPFILDAASKLKRFQSIFPAMGITRVNAKSWDAITQPDRAVSAPNKNASASEFLGSGTAPVAPLNKLVAASFDKAKKEGGAA